MVDPNFLMGKNVLNVVIIANVPVKMDAINAFLDMHLIKIFRIAFNAPQAPQPLVDLSFQNAHNVAHKLQAHKLSAQGVIIQVVTFFCMVASVLILRDVFSTNKMEFVANALLDFII